MKRTRQENIRLGFMVVGMVLFTALAVGRLVQMQVFLSDKYNAIVDRQSSGRVPIPASRGMIYDRNGQVVARDVSCSVLCAYPHDERELNGASHYLDKMFSLKSGTAVKKFGLSVRRFKYINRHLSDDEARHLATEIPAGLFLRKESRREYPFGYTGKQILGLTDIDNKGQSGFELSNDSLLAGKKGWADIRRDGLQNTFRVHESAMVKPEAGASIVLTIDWRLQGIVEEELELAVAEYNAQDGMAAFVNCNNGQILAMAHFDPDEKDRSRPTKCRAITDQFEPGSSMKAFTASGLLDAGIIDFSDSVFCEEGVWKVGGRHLRDDKELGWLNFRRIFELSSNIGTGKLAIELGGEKLFDTYERFGFGKSTECGLPGESAGALRRLRWSDYNVAALAMGHSVAVTSIQMAAAMAAIANGGKLFRPQIVLGRVDDKGFVRDRIKPELLRMVIEEASVDSLRAVLRGVVENGTATPVNSSSIAISGKTGTAEIPDPVTKRYHKNRFMASFAGFFPAEIPVIAGIVVLRNPKPITYGGHTSGKAFRRIAERYVVSNPDMFVVPERTLIAESRHLKGIIETPELIGRDIKLAMDMAAERGIQLRCTASEGMVDWQYPPPDMLLFEGDEVVAAVSAAADERPIMANLNGLSVRKASALLHHLRIQFVVEGSGQVVSQSIRPGAAVVEGNICKLSCKPS